MQGLSQSAIAPCGR